MSKHLPWKQGEDGFSIYVEDSRGHVIADVRAPDPIVGEGVEQNMVRHRDRARIFASAPEILEAAKIVVDRLQKYTPNSYEGEIVLLKSVIAKAEGRS